jgi:hypothetical protein
MNAYIISYFGEDAQIAAKRHSFHYQQICSLLNQPGIDDIHILAMDYNKDIDSGKTFTKARDFLVLKHPRIHYHFSERVYSGTARNKLLKIFHASKEPWAVFFDNDALIDPRYHGQQVADIIKYNEQWLSENVDILCPVSPRHQPFTEYLEENAELLKTHAPLYRQNYLKTTMFFIKNRPLYNLEPVYFNEEINQLVDFEYIGRILAAGGNIYHFKSVIMNDLGIDETVSTLFKNGERTKNFETLKAKIYEMYKPYGLTIKSGGSFDWSKINDNYKLPKYYAIPLPGNTEIRTAIYSENTFNSLFEIV